MKYILGLMTLLMSLACHIADKPNELVHKYENFYTYCPSTIYEDNMYYTYYCTNSVENEVKDYIYLSISTLNICSDRVQILTPSTNGWDSVHVCDPSIIKKQTTYNNEEYNYVMAYLGCNRSDNQANKIGLAVSKDLTSEFQKIDSNPIISTAFFNDPYMFEWGVGQPSIINTNDGVLIFYTIGNANGTHENVELWNIDDLNNPQCLWSSSLSEIGVSDYISNADFAFNGNELYMICDNHDYNGNVPNTSRIYKTTIDNYQDLTNCTWEFIKTVNNNTQNHNCGFVKDIKSNLYNNLFVYTKSNGFNNWKANLFSYDIELDKLDQ